MLKESKPKKNFAKIPILLDSLPTFQQLITENGRKIIYCLFSITTCKTHGCLYGLTLLQLSHGPLFCLDNYHMKVPIFMWSKILSILNCQKGIVSRLDFLLDYQMQMMPEKWRQ